MNIRTNSKCIVTCYIHLLLSVTEFVSMFTKIVNNFQNEQMQVEQADAFIFHIKDGIKSFTVNIDQRTCSK